MNRTSLIREIKLKGTYLCVGLDTDPDKLPGHLKSHADGIYEFNKQIIDATLDHCVSYKINTAFYEALGAKGWAIMERTVAYIPSTHLIIADAKRGDIGNTSTQYAKAFFDVIKADAITIAPYMGEDSIKPFLEYVDKWTIVLGLTSNKGANDFELQDTGGKKLYERVLETVSTWGTTENLMFVVGATQADEFVNIRSIIPDHFLLVPGVGAQGGSLEEISSKAMNKDIGILVNASRAILYASSGTDFAEKAREVAAGYHNEMRVHINKQILNV
ncbi:MAG: orotidine-5'-phosphate decarboxylase [Sphingobacteriales bacterium]|jgi:orotidine-5'-phosphate decarboxylase